MQKQNQSQNQGQGDTGGGGDDENVRFLRSLPSNPEAPLERFVHEKTDSAERAASGGMVGEGGRGERGETTGGKEKTR